MKNIISIFLLFWFSVENIEGQGLNSRDSITMTGSAMSGLKFYKDGRRISLDNIASMVVKDPVTFHFIQKAKTNNVFTYLFTFAGGFIIGWEIGSSLGGRTVNWGTIGAGVGCIGLSIPFAIGAKNNAKNGIDRFNASIR